MAACGKTQTGKQIAEMLKMRFVDTDEEVSTYIGTSIPSFLKANGITNLLKVQERVLQDLDLEECVVAAGSTVVYSKELCSKFKKEAYVVHLEVAQKELEARLYEGRGIKYEKDFDVTDLYQQKEDLYDSNAHLVVSEYGKTVDEVAKAVVEEYMKVDTYKCVFVYVCVCTCMGGYMLVCMHARS